MRRDDDAACATARAPPAANRSSADPSLPQVPASYTASQDSPYTVPLTGPAANPIVPGNHAVTTGLAVRRGSACVQRPLRGDQHEISKFALRSGPRCVQRVGRVGAAEDHVHAQLGRRRRPRAVFLRAEDGLVQRRRRQRRIRDRPRLGRFGAEGRRRAPRSSASPTWPACSVPRQGPRSRRR